MINPRHLLAVAQELSSPRGPGRLRTAQLRRSISTSYYALFHFILRAAANLLIGSTEPMDRFILAYRALDHARIKVVSNDVSKGSLIHTFGNEIKRCAALFLELQDGRHKADYDPSAKFTLIDAHAALTKAQAAISHLEAAPEAESRLFFTLLHFRPRP